MTYDDLPTGSLWRHHSGNLYRVFAHANVEGTKPDYPQTVVYQNVANGKIYARKLADWARSFTRAGG